MTAATHPPLWIADQVRNDGVDGAALLFLNQDSG